MSESMEHAKAAPMQVLLMPLDSLKPAAVNPRTHSERQVEQLAGAILEFGWTQPILYDVSHDEIVAGHGRSAAARLIYEQGETIRTPAGQELPVGTVPILDVSGWTEEQRRAALLADNALAEQAGWDIEALGGELRFLDASGFNLDLLGFNPAQTLQLLDQGEATNVHAEWIDMPDFEQGDLRPFRQIIVSFQDAQGVADFARLVEQTVTEKTKSIWFPKVEPVSNQGEVYV